MISQQRSTRRHQKILDAALRVFAKKGYRDAAVDDIAQASDTSKGGVYFHFPGKQAIFLALLSRSAAMLRHKIEEAMAAEQDPIRRADAALLTVLRTFASHRAIARLFMIEALGAGKEFHGRLAEIHAEFAAIIREQLDDAVRLGVIPPLDTQIAATAWFGALNEVVTSWLLSGNPSRLLDAYDSLRPLLARSVGADADQAQRGSPGELRARLRAVLSKAVRKARHSRTDVLACLSAGGELFDAVTIFERASPRAVFWQQPADGFEIVTSGEACRLTARGAGRFEAVRSQWRLLSHHAVVDSATVSFESPIAFAGFAFQPREAGPLPDALLVVPKLTFTRDKDGTWLTVTLAVNAETDVEGEIAAVESEIEALRRPPKTHHDAPPAIICEADGGERRAWESAAAALVDQIGAGVVEKVVLARTLRVKSAQAIDVPGLLHRLGRRFPTCTVFAFRDAAATFLGATPERLLRIREGMVSVDCLAGSISRGSDETADVQLAARLLNDAKELHEHQLVAGAIEATLAPLCSEVQTAPGPRVLSFANVQHLYTPISALALPGYDIFEFVESLHPTPATGGLPRDRALSLISLYEGFDRGWYAGPCGWVDAAGDGEFVVAIRSALIDGDCATLYAGSGIVAESEPAREFDETVLKMEAMLWALGSE